MNYIGKVSTRDRNGSGQDFVCLQRLYAEKRSGIGERPYAVKQTAYCDGHHAHLPPVSRAGLASRADAFLG